VDRLGHLSYAGRCRDVTLGNRNDEGCLVDEKGKAQGHYCGGRCGQGAGKGKGCYLGKEKDRFERIDVGIHGIDHGWFDQNIKRFKGVSECSDGIEVSGGVPASTLGKVVQLVNMHYDVHVCNLMSYRDVAVTRTLPVLQVMCVAWQE